MTAVLTLGSIGLGFGAAAVAGAVGLGIVAAAATGVYRNYGHGGGGYGGGHHGGGGFNNQGGHGGYDGGHQDGFVGGYRRRRSPGGQTDESLALGDAMEMVRAQDVTGCGRRLVCELGGADPRHLTVQELAILKFVGSGLVPEEGVQPPGALGQYKMARGYGEAGGNCGRVFLNCPFNSSQIMQVVMQYLP